jgi:hypothetical protein
MKQNKKPRREEFGKVATRAARRWGKVLTGCKLGPEDVSQIIVLDARTDSDALYMYAAQRNRDGAWDLIHFERTLLCGRDYENPLLKNVALEDCLDHLYRHQTPYLHGGKLMLPCDMRRVAAMIDYLPPGDATGERPCEKEVLDATREKSMEARRERAQADIVTLRDILKPGGA